jgi:predicted aspartyl protease
LEQAGNNIKNNYKMKRTLVLLCVLALIMSNVKSQTEKEFEATIRQMLAEECEDSKASMDSKNLKAANITEECACSAYVEAWMQELIKRDLYNIKLREWFKIREDMADEHSTFYNEVMHSFSIQLEKMCMRSSISVNGPQKGTVALTKYGIRNRIKITMSNSSKYFIMDTGADNSFISKSYARELEDLDIIQPNDYMEPAEYQDIHGNTVLHKRIMLNNVKIGDFTLNNVVFVINNSDSSDFLLGKDILNAFRSWNINNSNSTLELIK